AAEHGKCCSIAAQAPAVDDVRSQFAQHLNGRTKRRTHFIGRLGGVGLVVVSRFHSGVLVPVTECGLIALQHEFDAATKYCGASHTWHAYSSRDQVRSLGRVASPGCSSSTRQGSWSSRSRSMASASDN